METQKLFSGALAVVAHPLLPYITTKTTQGSGNQGTSRQLSRVPNFQFGRNRVARCPLAVVLPARIAVSLIIDT